MADLTRLFSPKIVAVIGGGWAENVIDQLQRSGFDGQIFAVHPNRQTLGGIECITSVSDLPAVPDVAFIGVNRQITADILAQLSAMGAGGAICSAHRA